MSASVQGALVRAAEHLEQGARTTEQARQIDVPRAMARMPVEQDRTGGEIDLEHTEIGRFASIATLLHRMRETATAKAATAGDSSAATGERLSW